MNSLAGRVDPQACDGAGMNDTVDYPTLMWAAYWELVDAGEIQPD